VSTAPRGVEVKAEIAADVRDEQKSR